MSIRKYLLRVWKRVWVLKWECWLGGVGGGEKKILKTEGDVLFASNEK